MSQLVVKGMDAFNVDEYGLAFIIKLVEKRVEVDLQIVKEKIESEKKIASQQSGSGISGALKGSYEKLKSSYEHWRDDKLTNELADKERWLSLWSKQAWDTLLLWPNLKNQSIDQIRSTFLSNRENELKLYLLLQEAVLTPIYCPIANFDKQLSERDMNKGLEVIARECGFPVEVAKSILKNTESFLKDINNYWGKVLTWSIAGTGAAILTAGLAAPLIAGAIGGAMGLAGAAATTAGLAAIGGGAIAAGGLGMAGGMQILIGGGALLGAVGGGSVANFISKLPKDAISVSMVKIVNYVTYLRTYFGEHNADAKRLCEKVLTAFLQFKHQAEKDYLLGFSKIEDPENAKKAMDIMHVTYKKLMKK